MSILRTAGPRTQTDRIMDPYDTVSLGWTLGCNKSAKMRLCKTDPKGVFPSHYSPHPPAIGNGEVAAHVWLSSFISMGVLELICEQVLGNPIEVNGERSPLHFLQPTQARPGLRNVMGIPLLSCALPLRFSSRLSGLF